MRKMIVEMISDFALGLLHSLRGFYRWYFYDQPKTGSSPHVGVVALKDSAGRVAHHSQAGQPLTSLALRHLNSKVQEKTEVDTSKRENTLAQTLSITLSFNCLLAMFHLFAAVLDLLAHRLVPSHYSRWGSMLSFVLQAALFFSKLFFVKLTNIVMQNQTAEQVFAQAVGRARDMDFAVSGSDLYASVQLQIIYYCILSGLGSMLSWFGLLGDLVMVFVSTPYWSLYTFDYCWYYMGVPFNKRLNYIEQNWPYFVGFGLPLSLVDVLLHPVYSSIVPIFVLPLFIISAIEASALRTNNKIFSGCAIHFFHLPVMFSNAIHRGAEWMVGWCHSIMCRHYWAGSRSLLSPDQATSVDGSSSRPNTPATRDVSHSSSSRRSVTPEQSFSTLGYMGTARYRRDPRLLPHMRTSQSSRQQHSVHDPALLSTRVPLASQARVESWLQQLPSPPGAGQLRAIPSRRGQH